MYPYLLRVGHLYLPTFGVLGAVGSILALFLSERAAKRIGLDPDKLWDAGLFAIVAAFVLSRVLLGLGNLSTFLSYPLLLLTVPSLTPAGLLLTVVATFFWLRSKGMPILRVLDAWAPCATLLWACLALGHFAEGSDPGVPSGAGLLLTRASSARLVPVALYAAAAASLATAGLWWRLARSNRAGETAGVGLAGTGMLQFFLTFYRQPGLDSVVGLDLLQWVALGMVVVGGLLLGAAFGARQPRD